MRRSVGLSPFHLRLTYWGPLRTLLGPVVGMGTGALFDVLFGSDKVYVKPMELVDGSLEEVDRGVGKQLAAVRNRSLQRLHVAKYVAQRCARITIAFNVHPVLPRNHLVCPVP